MKDDRPAPEESQRLIVEHDRLRDKSQGLMAKTLVVFIIAIVVGFILLQVNEIAGDVVVLVSLLFVVVMTLRAQSYLSRAIKARLAADPTTTMSIVKLVFRRRPLLLFAALLLGLLVFLARAVPYLVGH